MTPKIKKPRLIDANKLIAHMKSEMQLTKNGKRKALKRKPNVDWLEVFESERYLWFLTFYLDELEKGEFNLDDSEC